jgi:hypothetical protein
MDPYGRVLAVSRASFGSGSVSEPFVQPCHFHCRAIFRKATLVVGHATWWNG